MLFEGKGGYSEQKFKSGNKSWINLKNIFFAQIFQMDKYSRKDFS